MRVREGCQNGACARQANARVMARRTPRRTFSRSLYPVLEKGRTTAESQQLKKLDTWPSRAHIGAASYIRATYNRATIMLYPKNMNHKVLFLFKQLDRPLGPAPHFERTHICLYVCAQYTNRLPGLALANI